MSCHGHRAVRYRVRAGRCLSPIASNLIEGCLFMSKQLKRRLWSSRNCKEGYNGDPSWLQHMQPTTRNNTKAQGCSSSTFVEKARGNVIGAFNAVKSSLDGWTSKNNTGTLPTLRTVFLGRLTVPYYHWYIDSATKMGILAIIHHWSSPDWESRVRGLSPKSYSSYRDHEVHACLNRWYLSSLHFGPHFRTIHIEGLAANTTNPKKRYVKP
jgi:hypothetical protein